MQLADEGGPLRLYRLTIYRFRNMKYFLKQLVPPLFKSLWLRWTTPVPPSYSSYEEALKLCPSGAYEDPDVVRVVVEKNLRFRDQFLADPVFDFGTFRSVIGTCLAKTGVALNVIDFGGGGGYHYTLSKAALENDVDLRWDVVETTAMAREAKRMSSDQLKFYDRVEDAHKDLGEVDLVLTSGALHYCSDPLFFLEKLLDVNAKHIFITRTGFSASEKQMVTIQKSLLSTNGPGPLPLGFVDREAVYPIVFAPRSAAERMLSDRYQIRFRSLEERSVFRVGNVAIDMYGYFCVRKKSA